MRPNFNDISFRPKRKTASEAPQTAASNKPAEIDFKAQYNAADLEGLEHLRLGDLFEERQDRHTSMEI
ncbi:MAG: hypothetical protein AAFQ87_23435, partial [Bacteroidota bacterium]